MAELSVVIVATDNEQRSVLQQLVDGTSVARTVHTCATFPVAASDPVTRRVHAANPEVTLVDIPADNPPLALRSIEMLHQEMPDTAIFAIGNLNQPQVIVNAMRAGAREFIERPTNTSDLIDASYDSRPHSAGDVRKAFAERSPSVINAKGGNGSTTGGRKSSRWLCNLPTDKLRWWIWPHSATPRCSAMNLKKPVFNQIAGRWQSAPHGCLLARKLHDASRQRFAIAGWNQHTRCRRSIDCRIRKIVRHAGDSLSLCGRRRILTFRLSQSPDRQPFGVSSASRLQRCGVALERGTCPAISGRNRQPRARPIGIESAFARCRVSAEADAEAAVGAKLLWRIPNQYFAVSGAIDRGTPVMDQRTSEIARCFSGLAQELTRNDDDVKRAAWSLFKSVYSKSVWCAF